MKVTDTARVVPVAIMKMMRPSFTLHWLSPGTTHCANDNAPVRLSRSKPYGGVLSLTEREGFEPSIRV
jgi:hypothetical protein